MSGLCFYFSSNASHGHSCLQGSKAWLLSKVTQMLLFPCMRHRYQSEYKLIYDIWVLVTFHSRRGGQKKKV